MRLKTLPNTTIQRIGWTARARTSVGSRISFFNSISAMASVCWKKLKTAEDSAEAASCVSCVADVTIISFLLDYAPAVMYEDVLESSVWPDACFQIRWSTHGRNLAEMQ